MYNHTQPGTLINIIIGAIVIFFTLLAMAVREPGLLLFAALLALLLAVFTNLNVKVKEEVTLTFGIGLIKKKIERKNIISAEIVKNSWWYGWGIRIIPKGWMWNVSGLDAVELVKKNGRVFRIGTDEPDELYVAIEKWLRK